MKNLNKKNQKKMQIKTSHCNFSGENVRLQPAGAEAVTVLFRES